MTTAADRPLSRFAYVARAMSHYSMWFAAWLCITNLISRLTWDAPQWVQWTVFGAWLCTALVPLLVSYYGDQVHMRAWDCPTCVARTPILHGDEEATRLHRRLRWVHHGRRVRVYGLATLALYITAPLVTTSAWGVVLVVPWFALWIYTCLAGEAHRNLQPWCPWCRRRGDGDVPVDIVPPNPVGTKTNA